MYIEYEENAFERNVHWIGNGVLPGKLKLFALDPDNAAECTV